MSTQQKVSSLITPPLQPHQRRRGYLTCRDMVGIIVVMGSEVTIKTGRVCSLPGKGSPDNITETTVWESVHTPEEILADEKISRATTLQVSDPHLFRYRELVHLTDPTFVSTWFGGIHPPETCIRIRDAVIRLFSSETWYRS
jgi:hypothetical protein